MSDVPHADATLDELREWIRPKLEQADGVKCPVCGQHAQAYRRSPTGAMIRVLGRMLVEQDARVRDQLGRSFVHLASIEQETRDVATLQYWELIEQHPNERGLWRVTEKGELFLQGLTEIPKYAHVYRGNVYGHTGEKIRVWDVEPAFNYDALMRGGSE